MKYFLIVWLVVYLSICSGCGMVAGLGEDVSWLARATQESLKNVE